MSYKRLFEIPKHGRFQAVLFPADIIRTMTGIQAAKEIKICHDLIILQPISSFNLTIHFPQNKTIYYISLLSPNKPLLYNTISLSNTSSIYDNFFHPHKNIRSRDNSVGIATRYGLDSSGIESRWGARFSATVQTGHGAHPASCTMGTGSLPGVKRPGRGDEFKERVQLYLYCRFGPSWSVIG